MPHTTKICDLFPPQPGDTIWTAAHAALAIFQKLAPRAPRQTGPFFGLTEEQARVVNTRG